MITTRPPAPSDLVRTLALATTLALVGCGGGASSTGGSGAPEGSSGASTGAAYPMKITDCGEPVTLDQRPTKVLTVGTAAVSMMDAAGASEAITARSGEFGADLPAGLESPPTTATIIDPSDPSTEAVIGSGVDTVYGYGLFNAKASQLTDAGIALLTAETSCSHDAGGATEKVGLADVTAEVRRLGEVFGTSASADASADALEAKITATTSDEPAGSAAWVYYFSSEDSLSAYGAGGIAQDLMTRAGMDNSYGDQAKAYLDVSTESLIQADPTWIVMAYGLYGESADQARAKLLAEPGVADLAAVRAGHLVMIPATLSDASPEAVEGLGLLDQAVAGA